MFGPGGAEEADVRFGHHAGRDPGQKIGEAALAGKGGAEIGRAETLDQAGGDAAVDIDAARRAHGKGREQWP
jgi:hypothetical protein